MEVQVQVEESAVQATKEKLKTSFNDKAKVAEKLGEAGVVKEDGTAISNDDIKDTKVADTVTKEVSVSVNELPDNVKNIIDEEIVGRPELPALNGINVMMDTKPRATIGLIQLPSDVPLDMEAPYLLNQIPDLRYRMSKMIFDDGDEDISHEVYSRAKKNLSKAAKSFLPNDVTRYGSVDVIAMCCTSLSFSLGPNTVQSELRKGYPAAKQFTDMASASANAIKHVVSGGGNILNRRSRIGLLTPYIESVHNSNVKFLKDNAIDAVVQHNLGLTQDTYTSSVAPKSISDLVQSIVKRHSNEKLDAFFIGCSAFRSTGYGFIDHLEQAINIPVITSNQAVLWQSLVLCEQITKEDLQRVKGYGKLFSM